MFKRIFSLTIILFCIISSIGYAGGLTDSRGYTRNGKLEEYDSRAKGANSAGMDQRGYYTTPYYRQELQTGLSEEQWEKIDRDTPSMYFYKDGRPKPGAFRTPEENKQLDAEIERMKQQRIQEAMEWQRERDRKAEERRIEKKMIKDSIILLFIGIIVFAILFAGGMLLIKVMRKLSDREQQKTLSSKEKNNRKFAKGIDINVLVKYDTTNGTFYVYDCDGNIVRFKDRISAEYYAINQKMPEESQVTDNQIETANDDINTLVKYDVAQNLYYVADQYGNKWIFIDRQQAEAFAKEQLEYKKAAYNYPSQQPITKEWYRSVGQQELAEAPENQQIETASDVSGPLISASCMDGYYGDDYVDEYSQYLANQYDVNRYSPKTTNEKYVTKTTTTPVSNDLKFFVTVKFRYGRNEYDYLCDDKSVKVGDTVLVPARGEEKLATVTKTFYQNMHSMPLAANRYKKVIKVYNDNRNANNAVEEYEDVRCVNVIFHLDGNEYSYRCDDDFISEDDFVRVRAKGKLKTAKVTEVFYETGAKYKSVVGLASDDEIEAVADRFDEFANVDDDYPSYSTGSSYSSYDNNYSSTSYGAASTSSWLSNEDEEEDYYERLRNNNSLTDDRGYMRDGKAEELMYQLEKAKRLGRLTDDRGFIIDEDYVLNRYYHYDPDEDWEEKDRDDD